MNTQLNICDLLHGKVEMNHFVSINGWVRTRRDSKAGVSFIHLHDGSCFSPIQVVAANTLPNYEPDITKITTGCAIQVTGTLVASQGSGQTFEIQADSITVIGWVDEPDKYPMQAKRHSLEFLREIAHLRPRTNTIGAVSRIRHSAAQAMHRFFNEHGFIWLNTPIITTSDCEGAGELFRVSTLDLANLPCNDKQEVDYQQDFFGQAAFLTVSGQLNAEAYALAMSKVYTFGPTFRAENSNTSRHLAEFWMIEPEVAFADLSDMVRLAEDLLKYVLSAVLAERPDDMTFFAQYYDKNCITRLEHVISSEFVLMDYSEAVDILQHSKQKFEFPVSWGHDLQSEHERYIAEKHIGGPVTIINYPKDIKGFYMRLNDDDKTVAAMDTLVPGVGEIIGGSQREERLSILDQRLKACHLNPNDYEWYRDLRKYGSVPHAGFGLGFERLISYITSLPNIRDVIPFPRTPGNAKF